MIKTTVSTAERSLQKTGRRTIDLEQFKVELASQGVPREHFALVCPVCKTVQSRQDFVTLKVSRTLEEAQKYWDYSCIGRFFPGVGCDWTLGGLFQLHTLEIDPGEGEKPFPCFEPATAEEAQKHMENNL